MTESPKLTLRQRQEQRLTAQQIQSVALLQMTSQELLAHINEILLENPFLEHQPIKETEAAQLLKESASRGIDTPFFGGRVDPAMESLSAFVIDQLSRQKLPAKVFACGRAMAEMLDENGYLPLEERESLAVHFPQAVLQAALQAVQAAEPAGVGASDLSECLVLQLKRLYPTDHIASAIAADYLEQLSRRQYRAIARAVGTTEAEVNRCAALIAALEPRPGSEFSPEETVHYIRPDVYILPMEDNTVQVALGEDCVPSLTLSHEYTNLLKTTDDPTAVAYLREKQRQAKQLLGGISQRGKTLRRCAELMAQRQREFFLGNSRELATLSGAELAEALGLHPATVSRALRGKYVQCLHGVYPMTYFCSRHSPVEGMSRQAVMDRLLTLLAGEDKSHPYSDPQLQALLANQGITLTRRTVTKYRLALGIPAAQLRRR